ncbi:MAG: D-alanyl-D-alanine carboxypeptidase [Lentisphaerae bacterium]|nr:D-alanyl-D-alanine carboxypeptidase [Lentisphaerota bacterium]
MKYWIGLAVIVAHVAVLGLFLGPWRGREAVAGAQGGAAAASASGAPAGAAGGAVAAPSTTPAATPGRAAAGTSSGVPAFSPTFFAPAQRPLPAKLETAAAACRSGVLVDWSSRRLFWGKAEARAVPIASLTKMMTVLVVMQELRSRPDLTLSTPITVTREAALVGGRQVWLDPRETFSLKDILRCTLIHSANDAAFLLAQHLAGSELAFLRRMQEASAAMGLQNFTFHNSHGLPEGPTNAENSGSAIEMAYLAGRLMAYPEVIELSSTRVSYLEPRIDGKKTQLVTTNRLIGRVPGVNGMKTGFTDKARYCLVATCERSGRQVIAVATGCASSAERDALVGALIEWAYTLP